MAADPTAEIDKLRADLFQVVMAQPITDEAPDATRGAGLIAVGQRLTRLLEALAEQAHGPTRTRAELSNLAGLLRPVCDTFDPLEPDPNALADLALLLNLAMNDASTIVTS